MVNLIVLIAHYSASRKHWPFYDWVHFKGCINDAEVTITAKFAYIQD